MGVFAESALITILTGSFLAIAAQTERLKALIFKKLSF